MAKLIKSKKKSLAEKYWEKSDWREKISIFTLSYRLEISDLLLKGKNMKRIRAIDALKKFHEDINERILALEKE